MKESYTDCRSQEGVTVGLIDSIITISRVLQQRLKHHKTPAIKDALNDLIHDEDFNKVLDFARNV